MSQSSSKNDGDLPPRIAARPNPENWDLDDLMTLREAAHLMWPDGPLTERSLRTAAEDGQLPVTMIARKLLTTRRALLEISKCAPRTAPETPASKANAPRAGPRRRDDSYGRLMRRLGKEPA